MKFLIVLRNCWYTRNFERTFRLLLEEGHELDIWFLNHKENVPREQIEKLAEDFPNSLNYSPENKPSRKDKWSKTLRKNRKLRNYLRYQDPIYKNAPLLAERASRKIPSHIVFFTKVIPLLKLSFFRNSYSEKLRQEELSIPADEKICALIKEAAPDVVIVSPLVDHDSNEIDYLKSAKSLNIPVCHCVASWDNLTNKGLILEEPDAVTVWNEAMKSEAIKLHKIPEEKIHITGAQIFDPWFEFKPSSNYDDFCDQLEFDKTQKTLLYLCSSAFIAGDERDFVKEWIREVRNSENPDIANANLLIRPHPLNAKVWDEFIPESGTIRAAVWPKTGEHPINQSARSNYYDSMYHSAAITGINTSGLVEASIIGRPCLSILNESYAKTQTGTLHFQHLVDGEFLHIAKSWNEYKSIVLDIFQNPDKASENCRSFVSQFIRPHGIETKCSPILAKVLKELKS